MRTLLNCRSGLNKYFNQQVYIEKNALTIEDLRRTIVRAPLPGSTPAQQAQEATEKIVLEASLEAEIVNRTNAVNNLEVLTGEFFHRIRLVEAAIAAVVLGGLLNLTSVIFFHG